MPIDDFVKTADDKAWLASFFPAFMLNSQTGGKTWGVPFQRSTIVLYWNKELFKEAGSIPNKPPATWAEQVAFAQKLTKRDASGNVTQWGVQIPSSGFPYWLFQGFTTPDRRDAHERGGQPRRSTTSPRSIEALQYWVDLSRKHKVHPPGIVEWGTTPKDFFEKKVGDDVDHHRQPHQRAAQRQVRLRRRDAAGAASAAAARPAAATSTSSRRRRRRSRRRRSSSSSGSRTPERAAQWGIDTGYVAVRAEAYETPAMKKYVAGVPAGGGRARPAAVRRGRALDAREPARHQGAERRPAGGAHRHQDAGAGDEGRAGARPTRILRAATASDRRSGAPSRRRAGGCGCADARTAHAPSTAGCCCCRRWCCWRCSPIGRRSRRSSTASTRRPGAPPGALRRPRQLPADRRRPGVLAGRFANNLWFALGTIPVSIALAHADGALGQRAASPGAPSCAWPTSPRPCCR